MNTEQKIIEILDEIRPFLQRDGGDIKLVEVQGSIVKVSFTGYCSVCSKSGMTFSAVTSLIKEKVPGIEEVLNVTT